MLGGYHHRIDFRRHAIDVAHCELAFGVGAQPWQAAVAAHFSLALHDAVCVVNRQRHQRGRFAAGVAKH